MKYILIFVIKIYQNLFSAILGKNKCRFYPSCSSYSIQAINKFGTLKGLYLSIKRILKCHPFQESGIDEVPDKFKF